MRRGHLNRRLDRQQFAIDHPQLVRRLVLAATACRLSPHGREVQRRFAELVRQGRPRRAYGFLGPTLAATAAGGRAFAALMWLFGASQRVDDPSDMLVTVAAEDTFDASPGLPHVTAPTLLVAGDRDRFYSPELFRETAERIPGARLLLYPGKGHAGAVHVIDIGIPRGAPEAGLVGLISRRVLRLVPARPRYASWR